MEIQNAKVISTHLGYEDHRIMTIWLHLEWEGAGQGFGGYALDTFSKEKDKRIATDYLGKWVQGILEVLEIDRWEDIKGKVIRLKREEGYNGKIIAIGNLIKDKWFQPSLLEE